MAYASFLLLYATPFSTKEDPITLIEDESFATPLPESWSSHEIRAEVQKGREKGFGRYLHVDVDATHKNASVTTKTMAMVHLGDTVAIRVFMRGSGDAFLNFEETGAPFRKLIEGRAKLTSKWKEFRFAYSTTAQYLAGEAAFALRFKEGGDWADVAKLRVEDLGDAAPESIHPTHP